MTRRPPWTALLALLLGMVLAGCANIATQGPVQQVGPSPTATATGGVEIDPQPPEPGADPERILAGFLAAMSTGEANFASARLYLTPSAQKVWNPDSGTTIYQSENSKPVTTDTSASLNVPVVGRLDAEGRYSASQDQLVHDFAMAEVEGEWRIANPPDGLLIARYVFDRYYYPLQVTFLTADGGRYVQEPVYLHVGELTPTAAVKALLAGPSPWLAPAVTSAIPGDTRLSVNAVTVTDGIAEVSLTDQILPLADVQRIQLAAQIAATLARFDQVDGIRVRMNGQPWQIPGQDPDGVVTVASFPQFRLLDDQTDSAVYAVQDGLMGVIESDDERRFRPLGGAFGAGGWGDEPGQFALHRSADWIGMVNRQRTALYLGAPEGAAVTQVHTGVDLVRPQVMPDRSTWTIDHASGQPTLVVVSAGGTVTQVGLPDLAGRTVLSFRVSPDRTRIALVVRQGENIQLGMMRVRGTDSLVVDGWRVLQVTSSSGPLTATRDVAWSDTESLLLVAATDSTSAFNVYRVRGDGASVENLGPAGGGGQPTMITAFPRRVGTSAGFLSDAGEVYRLEGVYRWQRLAGELTALSLAG
ncbi:LpqB family beta-propeller domain-containing protein [Aestuariimicrobium sp. Y1814]|uniref:LpqB family beta-propeller domain-containing protein n=1 Tax=Aestuariimicrobium sp. Y1814 TaxID=3418742 RepID=UPI003DA6E1AA